jgi:hypothetical protein
MNTATDLAPGCRKCMEIVIANIRSKLIERVPGAVIASIGLCLSVTYFLDLFVVGFLTD